MLCREAGESVLTFVSRLFDKETHVRCPKESVAQLLVVFAPKGPTFLRLLLAAVTGAVPSSRVYHISEALFILLKARLVMTHLLSRSLKP